MLSMLGTKPVLMAGAVSYLRIVFAGLIFTFFYNFLAATMRALGDSKSALYFLMISAVLNIGGDLFFVEAWLGQRGLRPFHRAERGHVLPALRPVHPLESSGAAAGQTLVRV